MKEDPPPTLGRLWLPLLPVWLSSLVLMVLLILYRSAVTTLTVTAALAAAGLGLLEGLLLAHALPRVRLLRRRAERLEAIYEIIRKAGALLDLQEVLDAVTRLTVQVTGVRGCSIKLWDTDAGKMRVRSMAGIAREASDLSIDVAENLYHRSLLEGKPVLVQEALARDFPEVDDETESLICVPLRHEGKVLGALCVYGQRGSRLTGEMMLLLSTLGNLITLSIANAAVYENLKRLDDAKTWFLLQASHELSSPLSTIQSVARTLAGGFLGELPAQQLDLVQRIERRAQALARTVNDLLVLARGRAELSTTELQHVDFCGLLSEAVAFYGSVAEEKGVELFSECPASAAAVYGRKEGLESVIANLLSNAIKYTPAGGKVRLGVSEEAGRLLFQVSDTGIGIPAEEQKNLFREFFRAANARAQGEHGTGLGLTIVKTTVERHGGAIELESQEGKGTTVRVYLNRVGK